MSQRIPLLAGNWKMHKAGREAVNLIEALLSRLGSVRDRDVVVCPPFTALGAAAAALSGSSVKLGAQNMYWQPEGAFTGEISPLMLKDAGCAFVIVGHSERRRVFEETDKLIHRKVLAALEYGLIPILCVGETLDQRDAGLTGSVVRRQTEAALQTLSADQAEGIVIAYEPVWAIGTGHNDSPPEADRTIGLIRETLAGLFGHHAASAVRILYGGSVTPENIDGFMAQPEIDGALVGGACLNADRFARIVQYQPVAVAG